MTNEQISHSSATSSDREIQTVGVLGFGNMGRALCERLRDGGLKTLVYNRDYKRLQREAPPGVEIIPEIRGLAQCDAVLTSLPNDDALDGIMETSGGLFDIFDKKAIHIATSTVSPALSRRLASKHQELGQEFLVAAILGNPDIVRNAQAFVLTGGNEDTLRRTTPLLNIIAQRVFYVSDDPGMASLMKVACNTMTGITLQSMGEILALLSKAGIDRRRAFEIMIGTMFDGKVHKSYGGKIVDDRYFPAGMTAPLAVKDLRLALNEAEQWRVPMPLANVVHDRLVALLAHGWGNLDWSALGALAAWDAGMETKLPPSQRDES